MPFDPLASRRGLVHVCGHRGHSIGAPENTVPALEAAAARGATVCEVDLRLARDGAIVLRHDELLGRCDDGRGWVGGHDLESLRRLDAGAWMSRAFAETRIPTLEEALAAAKRLGIGLLLEIKERARTDELIDRLGDVLRAADAIAEVLVISFDHPSLLRARERIEGLRTEIITHARHVDIVAVARRAEAASVSIEWDVLSAEDALALHEAGIALRVTIPRPAILAERKRHGLDLERTLGPMLAQGLIDVLAGDDVTAVQAMVERWAMPYGLSARSCPSG